MRISRGKLQVQRTRLEIGDLLRRTVEDHRSIIANAGLDLEVRAGERPLWVKGDPARLAQAIGNLLSNAAKFTNRGVLGLGLALVKGLVEQHGGEVQAYSDGPGKGAEFTIRLPLVEAPAARPATTSRPLRTAHRILVIEDNVEAANILREALDLAEYEVDVAYDGPDGLKKAREFKPEVVLCDIGLPGMDGFKVARAMRADEELRSVHLVALTGYALPEDLVKRGRLASISTWRSRPAWRNSRRCWRELAILDLVGRLDGKRACRPLSAGCRATRAPRR